ncbi:uncharacterized protein DS421_7g220020 [Arachis hypogaea]|nr:uncharacterized protein DS421_7g220020 [Arachis hypogaea]
MILCLLQPLLPTTAHLLYALRFSPLLSQTCRHSFLFSTTSTSMTATLSLSPTSPLSAVSSMKTFSEHTSAFSLTPHQTRFRHLFFKVNDFSLSQITTIMCKIPVLFTCDPTKAILPNFQFSASKGASPSDIILKWRRRKIRLTVGDSGGDDGVGEGGGKIDEKNKEMIEIC